MLYTNFQPNIICGSGEKVEFIGLTSFSNSGHCLFSTRLNFIILKPWSLVMLHVKLGTMNAVVSEKKSFEWT